MKFYSTGEYFKDYKANIKNSTTIPWIASPVFKKIKKNNLG